MFEVYEYKYFDTTDKLIKSHIKELVEMSIKFDKLKRAAKSMTAHLLGANCI